MNHLSFDLSSSLTVDSIKYNFNGNTTSLAFTQVADLLECVFSQTIALGNTDSVMLYYQGIPPNTGFGSFNLGTHGSPSMPVLWTLSEPYGARDWWPCKQTLNDKVDSIRIQVTCPDAYKVASNGILKNVEDLGGSLRYHWTHTYPITAYLVAIAVTNYTHYSETATIKVWFAIFIYLSFLRNLFSFYFRQRTKVFIVPMELCR